METTQHTFTIAELQEKYKHNWWCDHRLYPTFDENRMMVCPCCGGNNLHQVQVKAFFREENSSNDTRVLIKQGYVTQHFNGENPSARRDGLRIQFECEHCEADPELAIVQHKGSTYIYWFSTRAPLTSSNES